VRRGLIIGPTPSAQRPTARHQPSVCTRGRYEWPKFHYRPTASPRSTAPLPCSPVLSASDFNAQDMLLHTVAVPRADRKWNATQCCIARQCINVVRTSTSSAPRKHCQHACYCWWRTMARAQHPDRLGDGCPKSERRVHRVSPEPPLWHILKLHAACASQKCHACQAHRQHKQLRPEAKYLWCWWSCETCNSQVRSLKPGVRHPTLLVGGYRLCDLSQAVMEHM
jgi:hypothetical protein